MRTLKKLHQISRDILFELLSCLPDRHIQKRQRELQAYFDQRVLLQQQQKQVPLSQSHQNEVQAASIYEQGHARLEQRRFATGKLQQQIDRNIMALCQTHELQQHAHARNNPIFQQMIHSEQPKMIQDQETHTMPTIVEMIRGLPSCDPFLVQSPTTDPLNAPAAAEEDTNEYAALQRLKEMYR